MVDQARGEAPLQKAREGLSSQGVTVRATCCDGFSCFWSRLEDTIGQKSGATSEQPKRYVRVKWVHRTRAQKTAFQCLGI